MINSFKDILTTINELEHNEQLINEYKDNFDCIIKQEHPDTIYNAIQEYSNHLFILTPLFVGTLFMHKRFNDIQNFLEPIDLSGSDRHLDIFTGKMLKYYYLSLKYLGLNTGRLYKLLASNREYNNSYTIAVLTNCLLDFQINNNIYTDCCCEINIYKEEFARFCFYRGFINLVNGKYSSALELLNKADILNKEKNLSLKIKKITIICKLLLSDYSIFYPFQAELQPYYSIIGAVRRGESSHFSRLLEEHRTEYFSMNIYFIIRRLIHNVLQEGLRKVSVCYSRIAVHDIDRILGIDSDYLLHTTIKSGIIKGRVVDGIFYGEQNLGRDIEIGSRIRETVGVRNTIKEIMKYPEIQPLTYESIIGEEMNEN